MKDWHGKWDTVSHQDPLERVQVTRKERKSLDGLLARIESGMPVTINPAYFKVKTTAHRKKMADWHGHLFGRA